MTAPPEARSPFSLLDEVADARELLVLSYTTSLDFFERFALSHARALGALVTVISDAAMVQADPVSVRRAGSAYLDARAICPSGAFHPKLFVLVGEEEARVGIGSGNLTMAGWHGNAELLTVLRAGPDGGPTTIREVADFLRRLAGSPIVFGLGAEAALGRGADLLAALPADLPGPRLVSNLETPILAALPEAASEELICAAPFYDTELSGLESLLDRLSPTRLSMLLESRTSVDGGRLARLVDERRGELLWIADEDRYYHGKLIEWVGPDGRWCLTGSPNISRPALLDSVVSGGNCELALLARVEDSVAPDTEPRAEGEALNLRFEPGDDAAASSIGLLAALRLGDRVRLSLHKQLPQAGRVEAYTTTTDAWVQVAELEPGFDSYEISAEVVAVGTAVRVLLDEGETSNHVFVSDLARVTRPQIEAVGLVRKSAEKIAAGSLGSRLIADIEELRGHLLKVGALVPIGGRECEEDDSETPMARPAPGLSPEDFLAACDPVLGRELTEFALVLPAVPGVDNDFDLGASGLDEDLEDDDAAENDGSDDRPVEASLGEVLAELPTKERERWRLWVEHLVSRGPEFPIVVRTLALRSVLHGISEEIWAEEAASDVLAEASKALAAAGDEPTTAERAAAGSLGAIAATLLRTGVERLSVRDEYTLLYEEVATALRPFIEFRERDQIGTLAEAMPPQDIAVGWIEACDLVAAEIGRAQGGADSAVRLLEAEYGVEARVIAEGTIELLKPVPPQAEPALCLALGLAKEAGPVLVEAVDRRGTRVVAAWRAPHLVIEKRRDDRHWGCLYTVPTTLSPLNYVKPELRLPKPTASWPDPDPLPPAAAELLEQKESTI